MRGRAVSGHAALARRTLEGQSAFHACHAATREALLAASSVRRFAAGDTIVVRGEPMPHLLLVMSGSVELGMLSARGKRYVRWFLPPGQAQGFIPVIDGKGAIFDTRAHGETVLLLLPRETLMAAIGTDPGLAQALLIGFCGRSRAMHEAAASDALLPLRGRVARMILLLADTYGVKSTNGILVSLKLSQDEFAALLSVARQALNRELKALEAAGAIALAYSTVKVLDRPALEAAAESAPAGPVFS